MTAVNVLVDRHHAGLYRSLQLLGDRLGWTLYTPVGREWMFAGYWDFGGAEPLRSDLAAQYLDEGHFTRSLFGWTTTDEEFPGVPIRGLSLDEARQMPWAFVVATLQDNQWGFHRFAGEHGARFVEAVGNTNQYVDWSLDPLVLMSAEMPIAGRGVRCHQEMEPVAAEFRNPQEADRRRIDSFVNCFPQIRAENAYIGSAWDDVRSRLPGVDFLVHGIDGPDGIVKPLSRIVAKMAHAGWGWHDKPQGDGYGHVLHMWAAIGRPIIGHGFHYAGRQGEAFWRHGETCIDLDRVTPAEAAAMIEAIGSDPGRHAEMCRAIRAAFDATVDLDAEEWSIRALLA